MGMKIRSSRGDKVFTLVNGALLALLFVSICIL